MNHQIWTLFELFMDITSLQKKKKEKGKGFTLIQRTGRSLAVGRPSGSARRAEGATSEAGSWRAPTREESGSGRSRLHLNGRGPAAGSPTRGAHLSGSSPTSHSNRAEARGGVSGDLPAPQGVSGDALPTGVPSGPRRTHPCAARMPWEAAAAMAWVAAEEAVGDIWHRAAGAGEEVIGCGAGRWWW